jgi:hypothetical protein
MHNVRAYLCASLCAVLAACAAKPTTTSPATPPKSAQAIDGEYVGTSTRFQAGSRACPHPGLVRIQVSGNAFQFRWSLDTWVNATIAADGAVRGSAEGITLVGRQTGPKIEGDVTNGACGLHFTVTRHS